MIRNKDGVEPNIQFVEDTSDSPIVYHTVCQSNHLLGHCPQQLPEIYPDYASW